MLLYLGLSIGVDHLARLIAPLGAPSPDKPLRAAPLLLFDIWHQLSSHRPLLVEYLICILPRNMILVKWRLGTSNVFLNIIHFLGGVDRLGFDQGAFNCFSEHLAILNSHFGQELPFGVVHAGGEVLGWKVHGLLVASTASEGHVVYLDLWDLFTIFLDGDEILLRTTRGVSEGELLRFVHEVRLR